MKLSVYTPTHRFNNEFFRTLANSIIQNNVDEWVIVVNGEALQQVQLIQDELKDHGIEDITKVIVSTETGKVGLLKDLATRAATGDIVLEVDHDDYLLHDAANKVKQAFEDPNIHCVYSNCVEYEPNMDGIRLYNQRFGWKRQPYFEDEVNKSFPALPQYMTLIQGAPNHLRAFRKSSLLQLGGYNKDLIVGDDHELLCRFYIEYGEKGFNHIDEVLYAYRYHEENTSGGNNLNQKVQQQVAENYVNYSEEMYLRWSRDNKLNTLVIGQNLPSYNVNTDTFFNLSSYKRNSFGVIKLYNVLHLTDNVPSVMAEVYELLAPGGVLIFEVPIGEDAIADPRTKTLMNESSIKYFTDKTFHTRISQYDMNFQKSRLVTFIRPNTLEQVMSGTLTAVKGWYKENWIGELTM